MPRRGTTCLLTALLAIGFALELPAQPPIRPSPDRASEDLAVGEVLGTKERARLMEIVRGATATAEVDEPGRQNLVLVSATIEALEKDELERLRPVASAVLFDYRDGRATRYRVDLRSREILGREVLPGVPQPSREELDRAIDVIRRSPELAELLRREVVFEGGFLADPPESMPLDEARRQRLVEVHLLSADRQEILRFVTVSLAEERVVSVVRPELLAPAPDRKHHPKKNGEEGRHDHAA